MVVRVVIALLILATVGGVALVMRRRPPEAPPRDVYPVPKQLDRADFPRPDAAVAGRAVLVGRVRLVPAASTTSSRRSSPTTSRCA